VSLTVAQVAERVQVHPNTVKNEIRRGNLKAWKIGNRLRIEESALQAWIESKSVGQAPERRNRLRALEGATL
jgi:excisionase family DNA binding protein